MPQNYVISFADFDRDAMNDFAFVTPNESKNGYLINVVYNKLEAEPASSMILCGESATVETAKDMFDPLSSVGEPDSRTLKLNFRD